MKKCNTTSRIGMVIISNLKARSKTQTWLSSECKVTKSHISKIICGKTNPSLRVLHAIARSLNISKDILAEALFDK